MDVQSVLIEFECTKGQEIYTNSGLLFSNTYVLITGNVLMPHLQEHGMNQWFNNIKTGVLTFNVFSTEPKLKVVVTEGDKLNVKNAKVIACFVCNHILTSTQKYLKDWTIDFDNAEPKHLLSLFFILKTTQTLDQNGSVDERRNLNRALNELLMHSTSPAFLTVGQEVFIESTPFGNRVFLNCYSQGVISNKFGVHSCLLLTDCSSTPGSEGSPVFIKTKNKKKFALGIVISCLNWYKREWIGLTLAANLVPLIRELIPPSYNNINLQSENLPYCATNDLHLLATMTKSIVQVVCGTSWGTGVLLNKEKGIFITNSHVIDSHANIYLYWRSHEIHASLIYKTPDFDTFDIAILKGNPKELQQLEITPAQVSNELAERGEEVYAAGYPLFPRNLLMSPSITKGYIAQAQKYIIKTTATVLPGSSGGAIFRSNGTLLGITVSNTKMDDAGIIYPRVNTAVPVLAIYAIIDLFLQNGDIKVLQKLHSNDQLVQHQWDFMPGKL